MATTLFTNVRVLDASGAPPFNGEVLVCGERIAAVWPASADAVHRPPEAQGAGVVDGRGATLMPGLVEPHAHLSFLDLPRSIELGEIPPEEHTLATAANARRLLRAGFTSCLSAAAAKPRLDVAVRDAIEAGNLPGPRLLAAGPELTVTGGLGDVRLEHLYRENFAVVLDGASDLRRYTRQLCREGVDILKINISGDAGTPAAPSDKTVMTEAEVAAVCDVALAHGRRVAAHARNGAAVRLALRHGVEIIYHANLCDEAACDELEAQRERIFVAPTLGHTWTTLHEASAWGITTAMGQARGLDRELADGIRNMRELQRRGVRVLPGGDYGFAWNRNGTNARDIEHFVRLLGFSPMEAIVAATRLGGEIMGRPGDIGQIRAGFLADLLLVDGDPLADPGLLHQPRTPHRVFKAGVLQAL